MIFNRLLHYNVIMFYCNIRILVSCRTGLRGLAAAGGALTPAEKRVLTPAEKA